MAQSDPFLDQAVRSATFGLSDPVAALGGAAGLALRRELPMPGQAPGPPGSFGTDYQRLLRDQMAQHELWAKANPWANIGASVLGGAVGSAPRPGPAVVSVPAGGVSLAGRMATGGGIGAAGGTVGAVGPASADVSSDRGFWGNVWDVARDLGAGALTGGVLGAGLQPAAAIAGRFAAPAARWLTSGFGPGSVVPNAAANQATRVIAGRLADDINAGGTDIPNLQSTLAGFPPGKPLSIADIPETSNVQALAGKVARLPGLSRNIVNQTLELRTGGAAQRIVDDIDANITPLTEFDARNQLQAQKQRDATAPYQAAYAAAPLNPDHLEQGGALDVLMQRPSMRAAIPAALKLAAEEGRDPSGMGITFNAAGDPIFQAVPSWQTLDYVKRGLDQNLEQYRNVFGRLELNTQGRADNNTRNAYVQFLDDNNPLYAPARASYAEPAQALGALRQGTRFWELGPDDIEATLRGMTPNEQTYYRVGAADALRTSAQANGNATAITGTNLATHRGADYTQQQIRALLYDTPDAAETLIGRGQAENQMLTSANRMIGGSPTAPRMAEDAGAGAAGGALPHLVAGAAAFPHEPLFAATQLASGFSRLANLPEVGGKEVNAEIARRLLSTDPAMQRLTLQEALTVPSPLGIRLAYPLGGLAGAMVPTAVPAVQSYVNRTVPGGLPGQSP
ncbi:MAG TPA: hypothetical protein VGF07_13120 [Stellaceae bacterium]